ncbi:hypothetical protein QJS10_CPB13g00501 [Acorus calamus]|uniref:Uncharacterized protein n=1 Tax=Acorus calamus TaxID=4465 RepID=A0AAV9DJP2_ACOCL|nr:hypothetical protein QJS10_CPB13g00501 [Acorus calamus]
MAKLTQSSLLIVVALVVLVGLLQSHCVQSRVLRSPVDGKSGCDGLNQVWIGSTTYVSSLENRTSQMLESLVYQLYSGPSKGGKGH